MIFNKIRFEKTTVPKKIVEEIKTLILEKKLKPGDKLPPERELSRQFNVSRNTVRESYKVLSTLGYIEIKQGHGVFVSKGDDNLIQFTNQYFFTHDQFTDLFEIRKLIETQSAVWAVERGSDAQIAEFYRFVKSTVEDLRHHRLDKVQLAERDQKFHTKISELSGNAVAYRIMNSLSGLFDNIREVTAQIPNRMSDSWLEHLQIADMIRKRDQKMAGEYMKKHLQSVEKTLRQKGVEVGEEQDYF
ncbi:MAG: FadR family transcriptional regulator [Sporolactobacillus sp.]|jgi:GntR family transcriptional repressor for pyruvate dehydrogenase complex|nr:FadR family transcriptional regulator [Sporolactobacillus sp.]